MNPFEPTHKYAVARANTDADNSAEHWDGEDLETGAEDTWRDATPMEDSVQLYLREIGQVALLNAADEVTFAQAIGAGTAARLELLRHEYQAWNERIALERVVAQGDEARRRLIQA